jgi:hypothetical protein
MVISSEHTCISHPVLSADGGNIYVELSIGSINKLLEMLKTKVQISEDNVFVDDRCGYNFMMAHIAQASDWVQGLWH